MKRVKELGLYMLFGGMTTVVNFVVYSLAVLCCGITLSNAIAWVASVLFAFFVNKFFVFHSRTKEIHTVLKEFSVFVGGRALSGVMEIFLPEILVHLGVTQTIFGIAGLGAKGLVCIVTVIMNYGISKWIF